MIGLNRSRPHPALEMNSRSILSSIVFAALSLSLTSCFSTSKVNSRNETSVGQQLTDLERARQQGIVTDREYARLKKTIIKKNS